MRTWTVDKPRQRRFAIAAITLQVILLAILIALVVVSDAIGWPFTLLFLTTFIPTLVAWQQTRMHTTADQDGLGIFNGMSTRHIPWAQVGAVGKHERYDHIVAMRHTDGSDVVLPGVHGRDVAQLRSILKEHR